MNLSEAFKDGYKAVKETYGPEYIGSLKYLEFMASSMRKDVSNWPLALFLTSDGKPYIDKNKINQKFMEKLIEPTETTQGAFKLSAEDSKKLLELSSAFKSTEKDKWVAEKNRYKEHMDSASHSYQNTLRNYVEVCKKINSFVPVYDDKFVRDIERICSEGFYEWMKVESGYFFLRTKHDVIISQKNKAAGIDVSVNVGKFIVRLSPRDLFPHVAPGGNNINTLGYFHPHISGNALCWGNLNALYKRAAELGDVYTVLIAVRDLISSYHDENPFLAIDNFYYLRAIVDYCKATNKHSLLSTSSLYTSLVDSSFIHPFRDTMYRLSKESAGAIRDPSDLCPFLEKIVDGRANLLTYKDGKICERTTTDVLDRPERTNENGMPFSHTVVMSNDDYISDLRTPHESPQTILHLYGPIENDDPFQDEDDDNELFEDYGGGLTFNREGEYR